MGVSKSAIKLRKTIEKAIECHTLTHEEYELIMAIALEDGILDAQEKALLAELHDMIEHKHIVIKRTKKSCKK